MPRSMTGFGKGEVSTRSGNFVIEARSVNHKFFDLTARLPNHLQALEPRIKEEIRKRIARGKITLSLSHEEPEELYEGLTIDEKAASAYYKLLTRLKKNLGLSDRVRLDQIASFPNVITYEKKEIPLDKLWPPVKRALWRALDGLMAMKITEGKRLGQDMTRRLKTIERALGKIKHRSKQMVERYKERLAARVRELSSGLEMDRSKLATEVAIFAERSDTTEEVTRMASHLGAFREMLSRDEEMGKKLDFIIQELFREANTVSAKAGDYGVSQAVITIKGELEKIREQVQNIE